MISRFASDGTPLPTRYDPEHVMTSSRRLLILGAGGHARVVASCARLEGWEVVGALDDDPNRLGTPLDGQGARVVETITASLANPKEACRRHRATAIALGIGDNDTRLALISSWSPHLAKAIIHPTAYHEPSATLGRGVFVGPGAILHIDVTIREGAILNSGCIIEHDCLIEEGAHISPGAVVCGGVTVRRGAWIGAGATLTPGVVIGERAIVGAGSTVVSNVSQGEVVMGTPARLLRHRDRSP